MKFFQFRSVRQQYLLMLMLILNMAGSAAMATPQLPAHLNEVEVSALANELSGEVAKQNLEGIARFHRQRASTGFHSAADLVRERLLEYGLSGVEILRFPADGKIFYGTQRSRPAWDAELAELSEVQETRLTRIASYATEPIVLAEDSESADLTADLVDIGNGASDSDYAGKNVRGKIVLVGAAPGEVQDLAVGKFGAAGIVSYAQNQRTAWSGDDDSLIRWGHLESFSSNKTFAFMVSLKTARALQARLNKGEAIHLRAQVKAGQYDGFYEVVTATIPGADPQLKNEEIAFSCHLDHQRPGANDNASGCAAILEVARTLQKLIRAGTLQAPPRTIRFIWPPEVEGAITLLNARPEFARRIKAVIHMDMVGGAPVTKAVFHVTRGPASLPSFIHDVAWDIASWVNGQTYQYAARGVAAYPLTAPEGGKEALRAEDSPFEMGSDHEVYQSASFQIPAIYLNDWPDRYIHTNFDTAANIDPTKLKRAAFIGAASALVLSSDSRVGHTPVQPAGKKVAGAHQEVFHRAPDPKGPLAVFGYDYFSDHLSRVGVPEPQIAAFQSDRADGELVMYEALNFVDGKRSVEQITAALSDELGPVPSDMVMEYFLALEKIGVLKH